MTSRFLLQREVFVKRWLHEKQIRLPNGQEALWSYDTESDFLEIFFDQRRATATIELADGVYLRFDRQKGEPLSIGFIGLTSLTQDEEFGQPLLSFDGLHQLPSSEEEIVLKMLQTPPLNTIFTLYSFQPPSYTEVIPVASFAQPVLLAAA